MPLITHAAGLNFTSGVNSFRFNASLARFEVNGVALLINRYPSTFKEFAIFIPQLNLFPLVLPVSIEDHSFNRIVTMFLIYWFFM